MRAWIGLTPGTSRARRQSGSDPTRISSAASSMSRRVPARGPLSTVRVAVIAEGRPRPDTLLRAWCGDSRARRRRWSRKPGPPSFRSIIRLMAEDAVRSKKTFTYDEAAHLLPEVRRITDAAYRQVGAHLPGPPG